HRPAVRARGRSGRDGMIPEHADGSAAVLLDRDAAPGPRPFAAWRGLRWPHYRWALGIGLVGNGACMLFQSMHATLDVLTHKLSPAEVVWSAVVASAISMVVALLFLLAVSAAEHGDRGQPRAWSRYALATLAAVIPATALVHLITPYVPLGGLIGWIKLPTQ